MSEELSAQGLLDLRISKIGQCAEIYDQEDDLESFVTDILTDLRHFCDLHGLDYGSRDRCAYGHYCAEKVQP